MLTTDQESAIFVDMQNNAPARVQGPEADAFRDSLLADMEDASLNGYVLDVPDEWQSVDDGNDPANFEKASTATEWLESFDDDDAPDLEDVVFSTPYGKVSIGVLTEYPEWMRKAIEERLSESFSQPYWQDINATTGGDIDGFLKRSIVDGLSIRDMAAKMLEQYGDEYPLSRGRNIARTESTGTLNAARSDAIDGMVEELGLDTSIKKVWLSVLGNTTRDTHAHLDGVPANKDGLWMLSGVKTRWPGDTRLPAKERCNCQCTVITEYGMQDNESAELIADYELNRMKKGFSSLSLKGEYSCVLAMVDDLWFSSKIAEIQAGLDPDDVLELENDHHVTVLYGLHTQEPFSVRQVLGKYGDDNVFATVGRLSLFSNDEADVLKFEIYSGALENLHELLKGLPHTLTHDSYKPHLTVAYLKPGTGSKYLMRSDLDGIVLNLQRIVFSNRDKVQSDVSLSDYGDKTFCPTGPGGGVDPSCGSGGVKLGVLTSHLDPKVGKTVFVKKQIKKLEEHATKCEWDEGLKMMADHSYASWLKYNDQYANALKEAKSQFQKKAEEASNKLPSPVQSVSPPVVPPVAESSKWQKVGGQLGTEAAGVYEFDGKKYYVKHPENEERMHNELLAVKLYEAAGVNVKKTFLVDIDGKKMLASEWVDSEQTSWGSASKNLVAPDFAAHAWLNNWDAAGANKENMQLIIKKGESAKPVLIDAGGSLEYKAAGGGGKKPFDKYPVEWSTLRDQNVNPNMAHIFGDMTFEQLAKSANQLSGISNSKIKSIVDEYAQHKNEAQKAHMVDVLTARKDHIVSFGVNIEKHMKTMELEEVQAQMSAVNKPKATPAPKMETPKSSVSDTKNAAIPPPPNFLTTQAKINHKANWYGLSQIKVNKLHELAQKGDVEGILAVKVKMGAVDPVTKKIFNYKQALLSTLSADGHHMPKEAVAPAPKPKMEPAKIDPSKFPEKPTFVSKIAANVEANNKIVAEAWGHAEKGDLIALKAMDLPPSPKLKEWHQSLSSTLSEQLNPPIPPTSLTGDFSKHAEGISPKHEAGMEKVGYWTLVGKIPDVANGKFPGTWNNGHYPSLSSDGDVAIAKGKLSSVVSSYAGNGYTHMNNSLRNSSEPEASAVKLAEGILKHGIPLPEGQIIGRRHTISGFDWNDIQPGTVIAEKGILSTSTDKNMWHGNTHMVITIGKGVKGLPANKGEKEIVLAPNQRLMVTRVEKAYSGHPDGYAGETYKVYALALPTTANQCCPP